MPHFKTFDRWLPKFGFLNCTANGLKMGTHLVPWYMLPFHAKIETFCILTSSYYFHFLYSPDWFFVQNIPISGILSQINTKFSLNFEPLLLCETPEKRLIFSSIFFAFLAL